MGQGRGKYASLDDMITDRNRLLEHMFKSNDFNVKLIGDKNQPAVIILNYLDRAPFAIAGFVKNFKYNFTTKPFNGSITGTVYLTEFEVNVTRGTIVEMIERNEHREAYMLRMQNTEDEPMYLSYLNHDSKHLYWSKTDPRYFLDKEKAESQKDLLEFNYNEVTDLV